MCWRLVCRLLVIGLVVSGCGVTEQTRPGPARTTCTGELAVERERADDDDTPSYTGELAVHEGAEFICSDYYTRLCTSGAHPPS